MRKFKNKKLITTILAFVMVFVMAGAFASSFQALLNINARVNMYAPTVDAIIAEFANTGAPTGVVAGVGQPIFRPGAPRFPDRVTTPVISETAGQFGAAQAWSFRWGNPTPGAAATPGTPPDPIMVETNAITNPANYQSVYVMVNFDNFVQTYEFEFALANVGAIPLRVSNVVVEPVNPVTDVNWLQALDGVELDPRNAEYADFVNVGGNFATLNGAIIPSNAAMGNRDNYSATVNVSFGVTLDTWEEWADGLTAAELLAAENTQRTLAFRIRYTVVPHLV